MSTNAKPLLTREQFYQLPDGPNHHELVRGRLVAEPPTGAQHGFVAAQIASALNRYVCDGGRAGVVLTCDTGFELADNPPTVRGPDVAFISLARYRALTDVRRAVPGAPDIAVEVLSPSQTAQALQEKTEDYLSAGAGQVWIADPAITQVRVHAMNQPVITVNAGDLLTAPDILPGFAVSVAEWFEPVG